MCGVQKIDVSDPGNPVLVGDYVPIPPDQTPYGDQYGENVRSANGYNAVLMTIDEDTGIDVRVRGSTQRIYDPVLYEVDFSSSAPACLPLLTDNGITILGTSPQYGPNDENILVSLDGTMHIISLADGASTTVPGIEWIDDWK